MPIHIGGHSEAAARRCGRLGDGFHPLGLDDDLLVDRWELARRTAEEHGRDPSQLELSVTVGLGSLDLATVERFDALGVHRMVCSTAVADLDRLSDDLSVAAAGVGLTGA